MTGLPHRRKSYTLYHRRLTEEHTRPEVHLAADRPVGVVMSLVEREAKFEDYPEQERSPDAPISRHPDTMNKSNKKLTLRFPEPYSAEGGAGGTSTPTSTGTSGTIFLGTTGGSTDSTQGGSFSTSDGTICSIEKNAHQ
jgi:hypothetical protein